ncbi:MAG: cytochrome c, partial [Verrucomicrobia bacterium]|nr:cytochrome c [Verrucomicrobiota bacterium]
MSSAQDQLDEMDTRRPVPLVPMMANHQKENMRDHLVVVQEIVQALSEGDFAAIEKSASRISYSEQQEQMCARMGAGAEGFADLGADFHRTADTIIEAAKAKDMEATLKAVSNTLARCTSCHSQYRQDIVDK